MNLHGGNTPIHGSAVHPSSGWKRLTRVLLRGCRRRRHIAGAITITPAARRDVPETSS